MKADSCTTRWIVFTFLLIAWNVTKLQSSETNSIPQLRAQGETIQLVVDGEPFLIRGGELGSVLASSNAISGSK